MKIFISWSGARSKAVAELMNTWIKCVIQASRPWISTRDIDRGAIWFSEINDQLRNTTAGIVFITQENKNKPWILFEAGALAKGLTTSRVCTFLVDLQPSDLEDPLAQFNHTLPEKGSMWELVRSLNTCLAEQSLDERMLERVFLTYWPQFEEDFSKIINSIPVEAKESPREEKDILVDILNITRNMSHRIRGIEERIESDGGNKGFVKYSMAPDAGKILKILKGPKLSSDNYPDILTEDSIIQLKVFGNHDASKDKEGGD
jgi:hypothetical protein